MITPASPPSVLRRRLATASALLLSACLGCHSPQRAADPPPDLPAARKATLVPSEHFQLWVSDQCLSGAEASLLLLELETALDKLRVRLGAGLAPGDFRPVDAPRRAYRPLAPPREVSTPIQVVVVPGPGRCHADADGITLRADHTGRRDGTHELVHYLSGSSWRPIDEGLAVYLTEELWGAHRGFTTRIRARVYLDLNLARTLHPPDLREGMSRLDYDTAGAFVRWLIESRGAERFWTLYHGPERDYHTVYGQAETELWEEFWRYVGNLDVSGQSAYQAYKILLSH